MSKIDEEVASLKRIASFHKEPYVELKEELLTFYTWEPRWNSKEKRYFVGTNYEIVFCADAVSRYYGADEIYFGQISSDKIRLLTCGPTVLENSYTIKEESEKIYVEAISYEDITDNHITPDYLSILSKITALGVWDNS